MGWESITDYRSRREVEGVEIEVDSLGEKISRIRVNTEKAERFRVRCDGQWDVDFDRVVDVVSQFHGAPLEVGDFEPTSRSHIYEARVFEPEED